MLNSGTVRDYEFQKFVESPTRPGKPAIDVLSTDLSRFSPDPRSDAFTVQNLSTQTIYEFRQGGVSGTIVQTITLTFANASKQDLVSGSVVTI